MGMGLELERHKDEGKQTNSEPRDGADDVTRQFGESKAERRNTRANKQHEKANKE